MKKASLLILAAAAALLATAPASKAAVVYQQTSTTGLTTSTATAPAALDDINFAATTTGRQELSAMTFGVGVLPGTTAQTGAVFVDFYDTFNAGATGSVVSDYLGGFGGTLTITANTGTATALRSFSFSSLTTLTTPIFFNDNNIAIVLTFTDSTGTLYSTVLTPLTSVPGAPTIGTSVTGVYRDVNNDGTFSGTELQVAQGNLYLSLTTIAAPVPEPSTYAAAGLGALALGAVMVRRNRRQA